MPLENVSSGLSKTDTNQAAQAPKMARGLKFCINNLERGGIYYTCSEFKGADQLHSYCALISCPVTSYLICVFVFVYAKSQFSHDATRILAVS